VMVPVHLEKQTLVGYVGVLCGPPRPKTVGVPHEKFQNLFGVKFSFEVWVTNFFLILCHGVIDLEYKCNTII
jgi:hypothetical protein